ncbi:hypothetical protein B0H12DRAFT_546291 [Mycena haematopus]|nr:hypothetical protein B0H12DRAFT_546291 [Mycena haematopus]
MAIRQCLTANLRPAPLHRRAIECPTQLAPCTAASSSTRPSRAAAPTPTPAPATSPLALDSDFDIPLESANEERRDGRRERGSLRKGSLAGDVAPCTWGHKRRKDRDKPKQRWPPQTQRPASPLLTAPSATVTRPPNARKTRPPQGAGLRTRGARPRPPRQVGPRPPQRTTFAYRV